MDEARRLFQCRSPLVGKEPNEEAMTKQVKPPPRKFTVNLVGAKSAAKRAAIQTARRNKARRIDWSTFLSKVFTV